MGCLWIYVGSDRFKDFEEGYVPWTIKSEHFAGMKEY